MSGKPRALVAGVLLCAVALAIGLSSAPQLHHWAHKVGDPTTHECAATLLSSGSIEHSDCAPVFRPPQSIPRAAAFRSVHFSPAAPSLEFSRLEHAPPALS